jgi:hypothetical protein
VDAVKASLDERDLILLNAYLDNELSAEERASFEQRLAREPALRAELRELQATVLLLGMAERVRAPRNFTLDPNLYSKPARSEWWRLGKVAPLMPLAAAGAGIVVVALCIGAIALSRLGGGAAAPSVAMEAAQPQQEPAAMLPEAPAEEAAPAEAGPAAQAAPLPEAFAQQEAQTQQAPAGAPPPTLVAPPEEAGGVFAAEEASSEADAAASPPLPTAAGEQQGAGNAAGQGERMIEPAQPQSLPAGTFERPAGSPIGSIVVAVLLFAVGLIILAVSLILIFRQRGRGR